MATSVVRQRGTSREHVTSRKMLRSPFNSFIYGVIMLFLLTQRQSRLYDMNVMIEITIDIAFALLGVAILVTIATTIINNEVK